MHNFNSREKEKSLWKKSMKNIMNCGNNRFQSDYLKLFIILLKKYKYYNRSSLDINLIT